MDSEAQKGVTGRGASLGLSLALHAAVLWAVFFAFAPSPATAPEDAFPEPAPRMAVDLTPPLDAQPPSGPGAPDLQAGQTAGGKTAPGVDPGRGRDPSHPAEISPVKSRFYKKDGSSIHIGAGQLKGGAEMTMTLRALADFDFTLNEYCGYYKADGVREDRYLNVVDARKAYGGLVFYDSKTGLSRVLTQFSKYIFTYGPGFREQEPVEGSIMFLPRKPFEGSEHVDSRSRLLWQPKDPPAIIATKAAFREACLPIRRAGRDIPNLFTAPAGPGPYPAVVWLGSGCGAKERSLGFARAVALRGIAVLVVEGPGCGDGGPDVQALAGDALAAARTLAGDPATAAGSVGVWGADAGGLAALAALAESGSGGPVAFAVCAVLGQERAPLSARDFNMAARLAGAGKGRALIAHAFPLAGEWAALAARLEQAGRAESAGLEAARGTGLGFGFNPGGAAETAMPWILAGGFRDAP